jgi:hypothetical protein
MNIQGDLHDLTILAYICGIGGLKPDESVEEFRQRIAQTILNDLDEMSGTQ